MNDQIVQSLRKIFPISHKSIAHLLEKLIHVFQLNLKPRMRRGKKHISLKNVLAALFYKIKTGCPWRQIPEFFGNYRTVYGCYRKVALCNFFGILYEKLIVALQKEKTKLLDKIIFDGSLIPAKNGGSHAKRNPRAQNKSVINVMFMSNGKGLALNLLIAKGTAHDSKLLQPLFASSARLFKNQSPLIAHADKGFDAMENRIFLSKNGCVPRIPFREFKSRINPKKRRDRIRGRIENFFARLKQFRALSVTFNRSIESLKADIFIAMLSIFSEKTNKRELDICFQ
jgi:transposase